MIALTPAYSHILFGHPVSHSLSPQIHTLFASQFNLNIEYKTQAVLEPDCALAIQNFKNQGGLGANITTPLKQTVYRLCQNHSEYAKQAQAVNTIYWDNHNQLCGHNTDGIGLLKDLTHRHGQIIKNKKILILGAGGAALGILPALLQAEPSAIYVSNRTLQRALDLALKINHPLLTVIPIEVLHNNNNNFMNADDSKLPAILTIPSISPNLLELSGLSDLSDLSDLLSFDIIINTTSPSLDSEIFNLNPCWVYNKCVYDLVYNLKEPTPFIQWARLQGAKVAYDGLGMLIEQAAESFYIWHHKKPDTQPVYSFFRQH